MRRVECYIPTPSSPRFGPRSRRAGDTGSGGGVVTIDSFHLFFFYLETTKDFSTRVLSRRRVPHPCRDSRVSYHAESAGGGAGATGGGAGTPALAAACALACAA